MPKAFPVEFRRDVVTVARKGESTLVQIAKDFGISEACLHRWLKQADVETVSVLVSPLSKPLSYAMRRSASVCSSKRTKSCVGRLRSSLASRSQNDVPAGSGSCRRRNPCDAELPGARVL